MALKRYKNNPFVDDSSKEDEDFVYVALELALPRRFCVFHKNNNPFIKYRGFEFLNRFCFSKSAVKFIIQLIQDDIKSAMTR